jgi:hypothetical protein
MVFRAVLLWYNIRMRALLLLVVSCAFVICPTGAQNQTQALPTVSAFECPTYPHKAESMRLQGMVRLQVTTDGHQIVEVKPLPGHPVLVEAASKNVRTWKFSDHTPTTFTVVYFYTNEGKYKRDPVTKCDAKMELPSKVTVSTNF